MIEKLVTSSASQLEDIGFNLATKLDKGTVIVLHGQLGAGKTTLIKGIARGLGINKKLTSPTFNIVKEYDDILCHIDAYRIKNEDIGIDYYLDSGFIVCIEWPKNIIDYIPYINYVINIEYLENGRSVVIEKRN